MKKSIYVLFLLFWLMPAAVIVWAGEFDGVTQLAKRRTPWLVNNLEFRKMKATSDQEAFQLKSQNGKIIIEATGSNAAAVGLNWYLKNSNFQ